MLPSTRASASTASSAAGPRRARPPARTETADALRLARFAEEVRRIESAWDADAVRRVTELSALAASWVKSHAIEVRSELDTRLTAIKQIGLLPPLFTLMGCSSRELPYNRMLTWIMDTHAAHGSGRAVLCALAERLEFDELVADLAAPGSAVELRADRRFPGARSRRKPDLLVLTKNATLLIESKVRQGETSERQYRDYANELRRVAEKGGTAFAAWLLAPEERDVPGQGTDWEWAGVLSHAQLGRVFDRIADDEATTPWGRVASMLVAHQLVGAHVSTEVLAHARALVRGTEGRHPTFREAAQMASLLRVVPHPRTPARGTTTQ